MFFKSFKRLGFALVSILRSFVHTLAKKSVSKKKIKLTKESKMGKKGMVRDSRVKHVHKKGDVI